MVLKATKVDGVYDKDPVKHSDAVKYETLTFQDALEQQLGVLDSTAFSLCQDNDMPLVVFDMTGDGNIHAALTGEPVGTLVTCS